ncbi:MAG: carboxypeptidase-like regulatory domain-containing protein [Planctomycetota bacterium]|nr:carboxypeptidase-like regulatory domain-containing protein [Planctomycetota bacterium]
MRNAPLLLFGAIALVLGALFYLLLGPTSGTDAATQPDLGPALVEEQAASDSRSTDLSGVSGEPQGDERKAVSADSMSLEPGRAVAAAEDADLPGVRGRVTDAAGNPLPGARVIAAGPDGMPMDLDMDANSGWGQRWRTVTGSDGSFHLRGPEPGALRLGVRLANFAPLDVDNLTLPAGGGADFGDLALEESVVLEGRVSVAGGGPVAGAELFREPVDDGDGFRVFFNQLPQHPVAVTDSEGRFRVDMLSAGPWKLRVESLEQPDRSFEGRTERPGEVRAGLRFELKPGAAISGQLTGAPEGGLEDLVVRATPKGGGNFGMSQSYRQGEVNDDGSFRIGGCEPGTSYTLQARLDESRSARWGMEQKTRTKSVDAVGGQSGIVLAWSGSTGVSLSVVKASDGRPLEDFSVSYGSGYLRQLEADGEPVEHHPGGKVLLDELRINVWNSEPFKVSVQAAGFKTLEREFELVEGEVLAGGLFQLESAPVMTVKVLDAATQQPIEGARVSLTIGSKGDTELTFAGWGAVMDDEAGARTNRGRTDAAGIALLTSFPGEVAQLEVRHEDHTDWELEELVLPASGPAEQEVLMGVGGTVVVQVLDAFGAPLPGANVEERTPPEPVANTGGDFRMASVIGGPGGGPGEVTDQDGLATFKHLAPGPHEFRLAKQQRGGVMVFLSGGGGDEERWDPVEVVERGEHELILKEQPQGALVGRVLESGEALAGASLSLSKRTQGQGRGGMRGYFPGMGGNGATCDGRGNYRFDGVEPGDYTLTVTHASRVMPTEIDLVLVVGENTQDVDLPVAIIEGRVTRPDGTPIAGVDVSVHAAGGSSRSRTMSFLVMDDGGSESAVVVGDGAADPTVTDADGRYRLRGVQTGVELVVKAKHDEAAPAESDPLELADGQLEGGVDLVLSPAGSIVIEVDGVDEQEYMLLSVTPIAEDGTAGERQTNFTTETTGTFGGLVPGSYRVRIQVMNQGSGFGDNNAAEPQVVEVKAGEATPVFFDL